VTESSNLNAPASQASILSTIAMITVKLRISLIWTVLVATPLFAAKFWETKEFTKWSEKECLEILSKSPWAYSNSFGNVPPIGDQTAGIDKRFSGAAEPMWGEVESTQVFEFRLLTAKPIRMALARMQMLQKPGDPSLKDQITKYVNAPPGREIVIQIGFRTVPTGAAPSAVHDINRYFLGATLADFRSTTSLASEKSGVVPIVAYLPPGPNRSFPAFVFPRFNEAGEHSFTSETRQIMLRSELTPTVAGQKMKYDIFIRMTPAQMMYQEEFAF
jgi:hypothetical protein